MTGVSGRGASRIRQGLGRAVAVVLAVGVVACFTGDNRGVTPPSGVIGITPGGSSGSSGGSLSGLYTLQTLRDSAVPLIIFYDSTTGVDDTVFSASFDSSSLSLNSDTSVEEVDFLTVHDIRIDADSDVNRLESFSDTTFGSYSVSGENVTLSMIDTVGGAHTVTTVYVAANNALTGRITYSLYNTAGDFVATDTSTAVYALAGRPDHDVTRGTIRARHANPVAPGGTLHWRPPVAARRIAIGAVPPSAAAIARLSASRARIRP